MTLVLMGLGVRELSMNSLAIPMIKRVIRQSTAQEARALVQRVLRLSTPGEVEEEVLRTMDRIFPNRTFAGGDEDTQA
jgi:phosphotransferase system enzyme I (PtsI)